MIYILEQDCELDGEKFLRYRPVICSDGESTFTGSMKFAIFDEMGDGPVATKILALNNVIRVLAMLTQDVKKLKSAIAMEALNDQT